MKIKINSSNRIIDYSYDGVGCSDDWIEVDRFPDGELFDHLYIDGEYICSPLEERKIPDLQEQIDMLTECVLELSELVYS